MARALTKFFSKKPTLVELSKDRYASKQMLEDQWVPRQKTEEEIAEEKVSVRLRQVQIDARTNPVLKEMLDNLIIYHSLTENK